MWGACHGMRRESDSSELQHDQRATCDPIGLCPDGATRKAAQSSCSHAGRFACIRAFPVIDPIRVTTGHRDRRAAGEGVESERATRLTQCAAAMDAAGAPRRLREKAKSRQGDHRTRRGMRRRRDGSVGPTSRMSLSRCLQTRPKGWHRGHSAQAQEPTMRLYIKREAA